MVCPLPLVQPVIFRLTVSISQAYSYWAHISGDDRLLEDIHETCGLWDIVFTGVELAYDGESLFGSRNMELEEGHLSSRVVDGNVAIVVEIQPLIIIKPSRTMLVSFSKVHKHIHRPPSHLCLGCRPNYPYFPNRL
ncbi:hypothetical protein PQX77_019092 [Marasmius sp. AFHP31]|nr:hypothetical protein PQX77_019092 [Marasmius sp. AFHP31]